MPTKQQILSLYKVLIRESKKFTSYNYRNYALRRVRDAFRENKALNSEVEIQQELAEGLRNLEIIKRQALIGNLYKADKLVIENASNKT